MEKNHVIGVINVSINISSQMEVRRMSKHKEMPYLVWRIKKHFPTEVMSKPTAEETNLV